jgi:biotin carboxyl carrier protein
LKLRIDVNGKSHLIEIRANGTLTEYALDDAALSAVSIEEVMPGVFSILLGTRSFTVNVAAKGDEFEVSGKDGLVNLISVADARDRRGPTDAASSKGPAVIRALMPGKIVKLLAAVGEQVEVGQGLMVVEAMKMQNEVKAPKSGVVAKIHAASGATVAAGEMLIVLE